MGVIGETMHRFLAVLALAACLGAQAAPEGFFVHAGDLVSLMEEAETNTPTDMASYNAEQFAGLMNALITRASKMRVVMNKLGISDTDSVRSLEQHFVDLGNEHADLGEGMTTAAEFRKHGLQARACVEYAGKCSRQASGCQGAPMECFSDDKELEDCTRAASVCGIGDLGESKDAAPAPKKAEEKKAPAKKEEKPAAPAKKPKPPPLNPAAGKKAEKSAAPAKTEAPPTPAKKEKAPAKKEKAPAKKEQKKAPPTPAKKSPAAPAKEEKAPKQMLDDEALELIQTDLESEIPDMIENALASAH